MDDLIDWARPAACREDGQDQAECGMPRAGRRKRPASVVADLIAFPTADQPMRDAVLGTKDGSAMSASVRGVQTQLPETDPAQRSRAKASASDPSLVGPVITSPADILRARELREQLKKKYLNRPSEPCCLWCVGAD